MKPKTDDTNILSVIELPVKLLFHPRQKLTVDCWNIEADEPTTTQIETINIRASCHSLNILRISKDLKIGAREFRSLKTVLDMMYGLKQTDEQLRRILLDAHRKFGGQAWLRCCPYSASIHGLIGFNGQPEQDSLLVQTHSEAWLKPSGMFIVKHKLLNEYFKSVGSNKRFVKSYIRHKVI